jgi:hypothetical protein
MDARSSISIADATEPESTITVAAGANRLFRCDLAGETPRLFNLEERRGAGEGENVAIVWNREESCCLEEYMRLKLISRFGNTLLSVVN